MDSSVNQPLRKCCTSGAVSGFLGFSVVSICVGRITEPLDSHWYYMGVAALIGLSANQSEAIRQRLLDFILKMFDARGGGSGEAS